MTESAKNTVGMYRHMQFYYPQYWRYLMAVLQSAVRSSLTVQVL